VKPGWYISIAEQVHTFKRYLPWKSVLSDINKPSRKPK